MAVVEFSFSEKQFDRIVRIIAAVPPTVDEAKNRGLFSVGNFLRGQVRMYIESNFETNSALTRDFKKRFTRGIKLDRKRSPWFRRGILFRRFQGPFAFMAPLARFRVFTRGNEIVLGFGTDTSGGVFDRRLLRIAKHMQRGYTMQVTPEMRRAIALTKGKKGNEKGITLKKSTTQLKVPERPVYGPVWRSSRLMARQVFMEKAAQDFRKRIRKAA